MAKPGKNRSRAVEISSALDNFINCHLRNECRRMWPDLFFVNDKLASALEFSPRGDTGVIIPPGRTGIIQKPSISHGNYWPEKHGLTIVDTSHYKIEYRIQNDQEQILTHNTAIRKTSPGYQTLFVPMGRYKNLLPTCAVSHG
ncbi:hypothetical protein BKA70DRAFT_1234194 [Coprinopsis sp. MPI-PUGE-AT-0042]|nr:hypothetical protein BKA70DRAFT_1234194 [Coprinopsis sp. MPI-PUGE-AT-0042]